VDATYFTRAYLKGESEMTPDLHMSLCSGMAEYLQHFEGYPLFAVITGFNGKQEHIWLELLDGKILDPLSLYVGDKPEWYQIESEH